ncbi:hypothetical protein ACFTXM_09725 [Streptomyces sp. NPDC056930]
MKEIQVFITTDPDEHQMEDIEDALNSALSGHLSKWDFTVTTFEVPTA